MGYSTISKRKLVFLKLAFKGNKLAGRTDFKLKEILFKKNIPRPSWCSYTKPNMNKYQSYINYNYIHQFMCTCQSTYIERTERRACVCIS